jgi:hypothetical protein
MRVGIPALLVILACSAPVPDARMSAAAGAGEKPVTPRTLVRHAAAVELRDRAVSVSIPLGDALAAVRDVANDPKRTLMLRIEGISVTAPPSVVYEVLVGDEKEPSGTLAPYGADESGGSFAVTLPVDAAVAHALAKSGVRDLRVTFRPAAGSDPAHGATRFSRLVLTEE